MTTTFPKFSQLPLEVQRMIIRIIANDQSPENSRVIKVSHNPMNPIEMVIMRMGLDPPAVYQVSREFHHAAKRQQTTMGGKLVNMHCDIICFWRVNLPAPERLRMDILAIQQHCLPSIRRIAFNFELKRPNTTPQTIVTAKLLKQQFPMLQKIVMAVPVRVRALIVNTIFWPISDADRMQLVEYGADPEDDVNVLIQDLDKERTKIWNPKVVFHQGVHREWFGQNLDAADLGSYTQWLHYAGA